MIAINAITTAVDANLARTVQATGWLKRRLSAQWYVLRQVGAGIDFFARGVFHVWRNRRYLTALKLCNMALVNTQFYFKTERVLGRPYKLKIESTNICNTKCQLCPTGLGLNDRDKGKMSFDQFKQLVDSQRRTLVALDLSMWGDPLIVPDIYKMIAYAHSRGIWTYISSNLHAFKPDKGQAEALVNSGLDLLTCSLHGATQATYEKYQPGKRLDDSIAKIKAIVATRDRLGLKSPDIQLNFVVTRFNEHEIPAFRELAASLGCRPVFSTASLNTRFVNKDKNLVDLGLAKDVQVKRIKKHIRDWLPSDAQYKLDAYEQMLDDHFSADDFNGKKLYNCSWPWRESVINWDGQVSLCCGSYEKRDDMGSVFQQPFGKIWNGEKYRMARRSFKKRLDPKQAHNNPCASCPGFMV